MILLASPTEKEVAYTTRKGDVVDAISFRHYGIERSDLINGIFRRNPHLCRQKAVLPAGIRIVFPVPAPKPESEKLASIWINPNNVSALKAREDAQAADKAEKRTPTQAEIDEFVIKFRALKVAGTITVPPSPIFIPSYYTVGDDGVNDPYIPVTDPVLTLV